MNTLALPYNYYYSGDMQELHEEDVVAVSGGNPVVIAAGAVALGGAALDLGYKLGGMLYKALH